MAKNKGLSALSITDHDNVDSYSTAYPEAEKRGFPLLSGVEFSSAHKRESIHILAYAFSLFDPEIKKLCERQSEIRRKRNEAILANLKRLYGIDIVLKEKMGSVGRAHIAYALVEKGVVSSIKEGFEKYVGDKKPAYVMGEKISAEEVIAIIKKSKGKAILAHPHLIRRKRVLQDLLEMDLDGIEAYYASLQLLNEKKILEEVRSKGWLLTGGSDFHGIKKSYQDLGISYTDEKTFNILYDQFKANSKTP